MDESILKDRGYLIITYGHGSGQASGTFNTYFLYSTLPGGSGGWQTFEYKPAILYTGGTGEPGATVTAKAGNLALGYNIWAGNSEVSLMGRSTISDYVRETMDGSFTALNVYPPKHTQHLSLIHI